MHRLTPVKVDPSATHPRLRLVTPPSGRTLRTVPCPHCTRAVERSAVFCPHCGLKVADAPRMEACKACGVSSPVKNEVGTVRFCGSCGSPFVGGTDAPQPAVRTHPRSRISPSSTPRVPRLLLLDDSGDVAQEFPLERDETLIGRNAGDLRFADDESIAPEHAVIRRDTNGLRIKDLTPGGTGTTWLFIREPRVLEDGDLLLMGSQVIRYRRLPPSESAAPLQVQQAGSRVPARDVAIMEQLLANGRTRDVCFVPEGKAILIGREHGNWVFPYDPTMSARHAEVCSHPGRGDVIVRDLASRNGVGVALKAEHALLDGDRLLLGRQLLRVDLQ